MKNRSIPAIISLLILLPSISHALRPSDIAPDLFGRDILTEKKFTLHRHSGKIRLVNFFSMYCKPCKKELPELALLEKEFPNVMFIAIYTGSRPMKRVRKFLSGLPGHPGSVVAAGPAVKQLYGYIGLPHSVIVDTSNHIYKIIPGYNTHLIKTALKELLQK
jgi:thiol-disulfide isomerase/thioredoxin